MPIDVAAFLCRTISKDRFALALDDAIFESAAVKGACYWTWCCLPSKGSLAVLIVKAPLCNVQTRTYAADQLLEIAL